MRFTAYLLISIVLSFALPYFTSGKKRTFFFGLCTFLLGIFIFSYPYVWEPTELKDYQFTTINYQEVLYDNNIENVILVSEDKKYSLSGIISEKVDEKNFSNSIEKLRRSSMAEVWFVNGINNYLIVKGIKTESFEYPPTKSVIKDNDPKLFTIGGIFFSSAGGLLMLIELISFIYNKFRFH